MIQTYQAKCIVQRREMPRKELERSTVGTPGADPESSTFDFVYKLHHRTCFWKV